MSVSYVQLGSGVALVAYAIWLEYRIMNLTRDVRIFKEREEDDEITQKIHLESDSDLDSSLSKHLS